MSDFDPRPINPHPSRDVSQLPAIPPQMPTAIGTPLPAAPWIETNENKGGFNFIGFLHALRRRWLLGLGLGHAARLDHRRPAVAAGADQVRGVRADSCPSQSGTDVA